MSKSPNCFLIVEKMLTNILLQIIITRKEADITIEYCCRKKYTITNCSLMLDSKMHSSFTRERKRPFIVAMRYYVVIRSLFGVHRRREQQYGGLYS